MLREAEDAEVPGGHQLGGGEQPQALSLMLHNGLGVSALGAGLAYTPPTVAFFPTSLPAARWTPRYGRRVLELGSVLTVTGFKVGSR
ncbi:hypothetical protein [Streptomyces sp. NPDC051636]|uniref:hypothetical protein n=1 Tax=Streptomyces sp. NPDC051636 TaxID=3365663 RepID=UPI0037A56FFB